MNKILHVNLGGYALTIDDDAFEYLQSYLENIRNRFSESDGRDEIMRDVESRLGELITQHLGQHSIVMLPHVQSAVEVMGKPEDFGGDPASSKSASFNLGKTIRTGKRLFRDEESAVIGGICSGLATYVGISDPLWMRLIFVLLTLISAGFWVPVYLLLWIIVPPARSTGDRLAMKGEPVNVDNIAREFEKGYERLSSRVRSTGSASFSSGMSSKPAAGCLSVAGKLFLGFMILIAATMVLGLGSAWVAGIVAFFTAQPYLEYFSPLSSTATSFAALFGFFVLGVPVVGMCIWLARTMFRVQTPRWLGGGLATIWGLSLVGLMFLGFTALRKVRSGSTITRHVDMSGLRSDTLKVTWLGDVLEHTESNFPWNDADVYINNERLELRDFVRVRVRKSSGNQFEVRQEIYARGSDPANAADNATQTEFSSVLEGNLLKIPHQMSIQSGGKWWLRNVTVYIYVPEGKSIVFDDKIYHYAAADLDEYAPENDENYISRNPNMVFRMTDRGLACTTCPSFGDADYRSDNSYENFILEGDFETEIRKGDEFSVRIDGDRNALQTIKTGNKLTLTTGNEPNEGRTKVLITTPVFTELYADNSRLITIRGFEEDRASITAKGKSVIKAFMDVHNELDVLLSGQSALSLTGDGGEVEVSVTENAQLEAANFKAARIRANASDNASAHVHARDYIKVRTSGAATVKNEGTAEPDNNQD